jgi:D-glycero-alpha-D-manno-heptose-7-phosphate kinase
VLIDAKVFGDRYAPTGLESRNWGRHPLLEAAIVEVGVPEDLSIEVSIASDAPFGASIGTSAATCVALVGALDALRPDPMGPADIARAAWRVETQQLGQQSGVQDQLAAAYGGINLIHIDPYPNASVERVEVPAATLAELERRIVVVYLGAPHRSSSIHDTVIAELVRSGPRAAALRALRETARPSAAALGAGDFDALGRAMIANTDAQRLLHRELVGDLAERVIAIAGKHSVLGHKVNGAGGDGGAITLLTNGDDHATRRLIADVTAIGSGCAVLSSRLAGDGLRIDRR